MQAFMEEDFLLKTKTASQLYHDYAEPMPIYDYHCHLRPWDICADKPFQNLAEVWLAGDHYKWRLMRGMGTPECLCTGDADSYDKYFAYIHCLQYAAGNPLYHWSHLELQRYYGIQGPVSEANAKKIWDYCNAQMSDGSFTPRSLILRSNVTHICTTDDPMNSLQWHARLREEQGFHVHVLPTFRADNLLHLARLPQYLDGVRSFPELLELISKRVEYFHENGCRLADCAFRLVPFAQLDETAAEAAFKKAVSSMPLSSAEDMAYRIFMLWYLCGEFVRRGWVLQIHLGGLSNNSKVMLKRVGGNTGFDALGDDPIAQNLAGLLSLLEKEERLPKTILYTLNQKNNYVLATIAACFQQEGVPGRVQLGPAWWFNDNRDGILCQLKDFANAGVLATFVGMLTDSRCYISYPRHEYFRRIFCDLLGGWVEQGEFTSDPQVLKTLVEAVCYRNALRYFNAPS